MTAMTETRGEYFDPESVSRMCAALDAAWRTLSPTQQTPETRNALAKAIVHLSAEGEFDPVHLSHRALRILFGPLMEPYVFEVLDDEDDTIANHADHLLHQVISFGGQLKFRQVQRHNDLRQKVRQSLYIG